MKAFLDMQEVGGSSPLILTKGNAEESSVYAGSSAFFLFALRSKNRSFAERKCKKFFLLRTGYGRHFATFGDKSDGFFDSIHKKKKP